MASLTYCDSVNGRPWFRSRTRSHYCALRQWPALVPVSDPIPLLRITSMAGPGSGLGPGPTTAHYVNGRPWFRSRTRSHYCALRQWPALVPVSDPVPLLRITSMAGPGSGLGPGPTTAHYVDGRLSCAHSYGALHGYQKHI